MLENASQCFQAEDVDQEKEKKDRVDELMIEDCSPRLDRQKPAAQCRSWGSGDSPLMIPSDLGCRSRDDSGGCG